MGDLSANWWWGSWSACPPMQLGSKRRWRSYFVSALPSWIQRPVCCTPKGLFTLWSHKFFGLLTNCNGQPLGRSSPKRGSLCKLLHLSITLLPYHTVGCVAESPFDIVRPPNPGFGLFYQIFLLEKVAIVTMSCVTDLPQSDVTHLDVVGAGMEGLEDNLVGRVETLRLITNHIFSISERAFTWVQCLL